MCVVGRGYLRFGSLNMDACVELHMTWVFDVLVSDGNSYMGFMKFDNFSEHVFDSVFFLLFKELVV
jgi:hypothetical protein